MDYPSRLDRHDLQILTETLVMNGRVTVLSERKILRTSNELGESRNRSRKHELCFARVILRNRKKTEIISYYDGILELRTVFLPSKKFLGEIYHAKKSVFDRGDNFWMYFSSRVLIINGMNTAGS